MRKPFYSVVSNKAATTGEILIYGVIGPDFWGDGNEAKQFVQDFQNLEKNCSRINVRINSPGGSVWDGLPMFNAMRASKADVHTYNDGICFSMGAILLLAGDTIHVAKNSLSMLHNVSGMAGGNAQDLRKTADLLDLNDNLLIGMIADKTGQTADQVKTKWMNFEDNFLTSQEMVDNKLADSLEDYEASDMPVDARNMSLHAIAAWYQERTEEPSETLIDKVTNKLKNFFPPKNNVDMKFPKIFSLKGVTKPTDAQLKEAKDELVAEGLTGYGVYPEEVITNAMTLTTENERLTAELQTATNANTVAVANSTALTDKLNTANSVIAANATKIVDLEAKVEAFGKNAGAIHKVKDGKDVKPEDAESATSIMDNLAHNKTADATLGKPKPAAAAK